MKGLKGEFMAKYNIMGYEVEIKAKANFISKRNNKQDELAFINTLICLMYDSADKAMIKSEIAENKGKDDEVKIHNDFRDVMLHYASELSKQYDNEKGVK